MTELSLSDEEQREILESRVLPVLFDDRLTRTSKPTLVLVVGQPGSGLSRASHRALLDTPGAATISTDALRAFHPRYRELILSRSARALTLLSEPAARWASQALTHARQAGYSVLLETSISTPAAALGLVDSFARNNFFTRVVVVATPRAQSLLATVSGHLWSLHAGHASAHPSLVTHDESWSAVRGLVGRLESLPTVDQLTLLDESGGSLFDGARSDQRPFAGVSRTLVAAHSAPMTNASAMRWLSELRAATNYALSLNRVDTATVETLLELQNIAVDEVLPQIVLPLDSLARTNAASVIADRSNRLQRSAASLHADASEPVFAQPEAGLGLSR